MLPMIERNKQLLTVSLPPDPLMIEMDSLRIGQIIINLLSNASKFTHDGGTITLGVSKVESDVVITVTDNGIGIAPEDMRRLFDPFFQVKSENGGPRDKEGLGIGLTLSQQLAELHGGQISVHSEGIGTGSTFTLRLPITQPKSSL
jgi:two-component system CheB/CheR fusion protein